MTSGLVTDFLPEDFTPSPIYSENVIKIKQFSPSNLFFSLSKDEQKTIPWFNNIYQTDGSGIIKPPPIPIVSSQMTSLSEENQDGDAQEKETTISAKEFADDLQSMEQCIVKEEFHSKAIIDKSRPLKSLMYPYTDEPIEIKCLEVSEILFDTESIESLKGKFFIDMFTWVKHYQAANEQDFQPYSEVVRFKYGYDSNPGFFAFKKKLEKAVLPFPKDDDAMLIMLLFTECKHNQNVDGELVGISALTINSAKNDIKLKWIDYKPGIRIQDYLKISEYNEISSIMKIKILPDFSTDNLCRLTSLDNIHPTPLLTISNLSIDFNHTLFSSKSNIVVGVSLKKIPLDPKNDPKLFPAFILPDNDKKIELGYSHLVFKGESITVLKPLNFYLDFVINEPLSLIIDVYIIEKGKLNLVLSGSTKFTKRYEIHSIKLESKGFHVKAAFSRVENIATFTTLFPSLVCPSNSIKQSLLIACGDASYEDPMFNEVSPFIIQKCLTLNPLESLDFNKFINFIIKSDMVEVQSWIEHFFTPPPGFTKRFTKLVFENLDIIATCPMLPFLIIFKSMAVEKEFDFEFTKGIFKEVALSKKVDVIVCASDFLIQLRMFFDSENIHKIACYFISLLETKNRFIVFERVFSDISFIGFLALRKYEDSDRPYSPYVSLFSLFFKTVMNAFLENDVGLIKKVDDSLLIIAYMLEHHVEPDEALIMAKTLFPLLPLIFTYYDSLSTQYENTNNLSPILLFLVKNCDSHQFLTYYSFLTNDSKIRFLEFLIIVFDSSLNLLNKNEYTYEVTWRLLYFISHLLDADIKNVLEIQEIIRVLFHILKTPNQKSNIFSTLFKILSSFISKFADMILNDENNTLIIPIILNIIPITQMESIEPRMYSIGIIIWIIELEKKFNKSSFRTHIALLYSVVNSFLNSEGNYIPFWEYLPSDFSDINDLYNKLKLSTELSSNEDKEILQLLNICQDYKDFPSIRAEIYKKIVSIKVKSSNFTSAFITQWKLCGLIAEVFKLKKQFVEGIPKEGFSAFPYIVDEPPVDISSYPEHSKFLILESSIFTEDSMSQCLQDALNYCIEAKLFWIIGDISSFLLEFLEKKRLFSTLKNVFRKISDAYSKLQSNEEIQIEFMRIAVSNTYVDKTGFSEAICIFPKGQFEKLVPYWKKLYNAERIIHQPLESRQGIPFIPSISNEKNLLELFQVEPILDDLYKLNVKTFFRDVLCPNVVNWDDTMVQRFTFETEKSLPCCTSYSKICKYQEEKITKEEFYIQKLAKIKEEMKNCIDNYKAVLPPKKMLNSWKQYVAGISSAPIINTFSTILSSNENKDPYYSLISTVNSGQKTPNVPERIIDLCKEVWQVMKDLWPIYQILSEMNDLTENEKQQFDAFKNLMTSKSYSNS